MRRARWLLATVAGAIVVVVVLWATYVPRYQLLSRSEVVLGAVLELYIEKYGEMPGGFHDLESAGLLKRVSYSGQDEWQVAAEGLPRIVLFQIDDLSVRWALPIQSLIVRDGQLISLETGRHVHFVESKCWYVRSSDAVSLRIYESLRNRLTPTPTTSPSREPSTNPG